MTISIEASRSQGWGCTTIGRVRYGLLAFCVVAQAVTLAMTWPLWQMRDHPPHLPMFDLPQMPFGLLLMLSLIVVLARPQLGLFFHATVLLLSYVFDQFRTQPQFIGIAFMMLATVDLRAAAISKWYLVSLWLWSGLHKLLSPEWLGFHAWTLVGQLGLDQDQYYATLAVTVALAEIALGLLAVIRPRAAAAVCVLLHVSIVLFLSPWGINWNFSVIPWNLCTATVGCWILWHAASGLPRTKIEASAAAIFLLLPAGFYTGYVDHYFAHVLYSGNVPRAMISNEEGAVEVEDWGSLKVPFPNERRLFRIYFARSAPSGSKMHIADPRPWLGDQYQLKRADGTIAELTAERFFEDTVGSAAGVGIDSFSSLFCLSQAGVRMLKRTPESMVYAVEIPPEKYDESLLRQLAGLPNLEQLQLAGCSVRDQDLRHLHTLNKLVGIGLDDTDVTDAALGILADLPRLVYIEHQNTQITDSGLQRFGFK